MEPGSVPVDCWTSVTDVVHERIELVRARWGPARTPLPKSQPAFDGFSIHAKVASDALDRGPGAQNGQHSPDELLPHHVAQISVTVRSTPQATCHRARS